MMILIDNDDEYIDLDHFTLAIFYYLFMDWLQLLFMLRISFAPAEVQKRNLISKQEVTIMEKCEEHDGQSSGGVHYNGEIYSTGTVLRESKITQ